jgi:hypothetical protein
VRLWCEPSEPKPHAQFREARQTALASVGAHDRRQGVVWRVVVRGDQRGVKARGPANSSAQQGLAPDCLQPPLVPRSGFRQQVKPSVAMTSNVKSGEQVFLGLHAVFFPSCIGRAGASHMRRLILLLSVGWVPPYLRPSGACLCLGSSVLDQPLNAAAGDTTPGLRLCRCTWGTF